MIATSRANLIILPLYIHMFTPLVPGVLGATVKSVGLRSLMIGMNEVLASLNIPQAWDTWVFHEQTKNWNDMQFDGYQGDLLWNAHGKPNALPCWDLFFLPIGKSLNTRSWRIWRERRNDLPVMADPSRCCRRCLWSRWSYWKLFKILKISRNGRSSVFGTPRFPVL